MNVRAALLAIATASAFFVAACGGGGDGGGGSGSGSGDSNSNSSSGGGTGSANSNSSGGGTGANSTGSSCQSQPVVGGDLFVVQQGPVGVTLLSNAVSSPYTLTFLYNNVFGIPTNNQQDKWGQTTLFPPGTPVGTSTQVQLQPYTGFVHGEQTPATFPQGIPIELWFFLNNTDPPGPAKSSSTASIGKDIPNDFWHTATVTYGANSTATVTFFLGGVPSFAVSLTNVSGKDAPTGCD
jgi:hypothetical protein